MNYVEQFVEIIPLMEKLYEKYPAYVHMDFTLGTNMNSNIPEPYIKYNIYTPEISHNSYSNFESFIAFIKLILSNGINNVRINILEKQIETAKANIISQEQIITRCKKDLEKVPTMLHEKPLGTQMADAFDKILEPKD